MNEPLKENDKLKKDVKEDTQIVCLNCMYLE